MRRFPGPPPELAEEVSRIEIDAPVVAGNTGLQTANNFA